MNPASSKTTAQVRQEFIDFFVQRASHTFVRSAPVVPLHDPTLLFTNAGMNQFKPIFLGEVAPSSPLAGLKRAVNTQKCIRAGGKHNDLEDVGRDGYHHTFFEMLGNWSFGDYFKAEAIQWAWELLTDIWGLDPERLYATYFEGNPEVGLEPDREAYELWMRHLPAERILPGGMQDNFWEMGETGPCGPCSELNYDGRPDDQRAGTPGHELVNRESPDVVEIWNLVFIQFNRTADGLDPLPAMHVDTGMGLERITRVLQGKASNYDIDVFTPLFHAIEDVCGVRSYGGSFDDPIDTAYRVIADHIRTLTFAINDGAPPSNEGRGYVLRRILRRAVRYGRQTLGAEHSFLYELVPTVISSMQGAFPELAADPQRIIDIIREEEESFGRTLDLGIRFWWSAAGSAMQRATSDPSAGEKLVLLAKPKPSEPEKQGGPIYFDSPARLARSGSGETEIWSGRWDTIDLREERFEPLRPVTISAEDAFKLHDTFGFPIDLTRLMAHERGFDVDVEGFERLMAEARDQSRAASREDVSAGLTLTAQALEDLRNLRIKPTDDSARFLGHKLRAEVKTIWNGSDFDENIIASHTRPTDRFAVICDRTNHYAEMGGQVGDAGRMVVTRERKAGGNIAGGGEFVIDDTQVVGGYVLHIGRIARGEIRTGDEVELRIDPRRRTEIAANHTTTHLLNLSLRDLLGDHAEQKGSLVAPDRLRFDFSHAHAVDMQQIVSIEQMVNGLIHKDLPVDSAVVPLEEGRKIHGLRAVFGETYPDPVRVVTIGRKVEELLADPRNERWLNVSTEFCGGTHLSSTGEAGQMVIVAEEAVSKGVRRITALTGVAAQNATGRARRIESRVEGAFGLDDRYLTAEVTELTSAIDESVIPLLARVELRGKLKELQLRVRELKKQQAGTGRERAVGAARDLSLEARGDLVVGEIPAGSDRAALLAAMDTIRARRSGAAILLISGDADEGRVTIVANVPQTLVAAGLNAGDWVRTTSAVVGGKGGGRADAAQGGGTDPTKIQDAIGQARRFALEHVG